MGQGGSRAFVISPIGGTKNGRPDERRRYADLVFSKIIEPALQIVSAQGFEIEPVRGDHDRDPQRIMDGVIEAITEDDVIIALLSEHDGRTQNPNVYYELGVAHCAGRPVILLKDSRQDVPFDLTGARFLSFEPRHLQSMLGRDPAAEGGPVGELAKAVKALLTENDLYRQPFGKDIALGRQGARDRFKSISPEEWSEFLLDAEEYIVLAGTTLKDLIIPEKALFRAPDDRGVISKPSNLETLLAIAISKGVNVTALFYDIEHPILPHIMKETGDRDLDGTDDTLQRLRGEIELSKRWWRAAHDRIYAAIANAGGKPSPRLGTLSVHQVRRGCIYQRVSLTEKRVVATANFYDFAYNSGPCVDARAKTQWHTSVRDDMLYLARLNPPMSMAGAAVA